MIKYCFFLLLLISSELFAGWSKEMILDMNEKSKEALKISDPVSATFWGGVKRFLNIPWNRGELVDLESKFFLQKKLKIYFSESPVKNAPLFVYMPGIYGQPTFGLTPHFISHLESLGGHVLVVPNILSPLYVEAHPIYDQEPLNVEIGVMEEALNFVLKKIPNIKKIHVVAESLGSMAASSWTAYDRENLKRITDLTLFWPPLNLYTAMENFDKLIARFSNVKCSILNKISTIGFKFLIPSFPNELSEDDMNCVGAILLDDIFIKTMKLSYETYLKASKKLPSKNYPSNFRSFFENYRPEIWIALENRGPATKLYYWIQKIKQDKDFKLRIMTSRNDFLNQGESWDEFKKNLKLKDEELALLDWGGHCGPAGLPKFREYLAKTFGNYTD